MKEEVYKRKANNLSENERHIESTKKRLIKLDVLASIKFFKYLDILTVLMKIFNTINIKNI